MELPNYYFKLIQYRVWLDNVEEIENLYEKEYRSLTKIEKYVPSHFEIWLQEAKGEQERRLNQKNEPTTSLDEFTPLEQQFEESLEAFFYYIDEIVNMRYQQ